MISRLHDTNQRILYTRGSSKSVRMSLLSDLLKYPILIVMEKNMDQFEVHDPAILANARINPGQCRRTGRNGPRSGQCRPAQ